MKGLRLPFVSAVGTLIILACVSLSGSSLWKSDSHQLMVAFLDVGQGDATLIESPTGIQVLIDGGKGAAVLGALYKHMGFFDRTIDMIIATHPDMDHIGGLIGVLERYKVETILMTKNMSDTPAFELFQERVQAEGAEIIYARRGQEYELGSGKNGSATLQILFPDHDPSGLESNTSSIVTRLVYGESEFLFTGDSPQEIEEYLVALGSTTLNSDVLKIGHHGSKTSSGEIFISAVAPSIAIISSGKDNSYGHPHKEVTDRLSAHNIMQKNTADEGSIVLMSDGTNIWLK